jgi:hypothetical protein
VYVLCVVWLVRAGCTLMGAVLARRVIREGCTNSNLFIIERGVVIIWRNEKSGAESRTSETNRNSAVSRASSSAELSVASQGSTQCTHSPLQSCTLFSLTYWCVSALCVWGRWGVGAAGAS